MTSYENENFDITAPTPIARVQAYLDFFGKTGKPYHGFDVELMTNHLKAVSSTDAPRAITIFELKVPLFLCNRLDILHGGAVALIMDMCTSASQAAIARHDFWHFGGLTRTLSITYLRPAALGTVVLIEAEVMQQGKHMALIRGQIKKKDDGSLLYSAEHGKFHPNSGGRL